ncbi:hypothetical protein NS506_01328 [Nocardia seriolae]|uniref:Uncharacterized protein n=1 Tax=Nocardia seriolae TaxID=37332 RepID=A0ABC9YNE0_9NOCA|nr:hypothetical protein NS506_01328 [Nocardia seriolae]GEM22448.1 hypothetical protein NS2_06870 [Nocardia seriolae NBRC 15557]BEK91485.1 hypothetical protein NSERKGN1266_74360 [Nocardia seriolae]BEK99690.1 hypothetical protein NSER024013_75960 [Nocardia seriolae]GAM44715.1 hypothetical protein NS07_v2contig00007-0001 [Nocardia seriolae]
MLHSGRNDWLFRTPPEHQRGDPATVRETQRIYFDPSTPPDVYVQPGAGHGIAHEPNGADGFDAVLTWLAERGFDRRPRSRGRAQIGLTSETSQRLPFLSSVTRSRLAS